MRGRPVLLNPYYWPEVRRGSERFIHDLGSGLAERGLTPVLLTSAPWRAGLRARSEDGIEVLRAPRLPDWPSQRRLVAEPIAHSGAAAIGLVRRRREAGVLHAFHVVDAWWALRLRGRRPPVIFSVMGIPDLAGIRGHRRRRRLWADVVAGSDAVLALSDAAASAVASLGVDPLVIRPGIDLGAFTPPPAPARSRRPAILCPADRGDPRKRVDLLVEAHRLLQRTRPELELVLSARGGPTGLGPGVRIVDLDRHEDLLAAYRNAWVTVLPSRAEAFGLVLVESLACGTPVVGNADGGASEIIDSERAGRLFAGDDPAGLAAAIEGALELADGEPATACRERASNFSVENMVSAHLELYDRLAPS